MKQSHAFVARRALASHCAALTRPGPGSADLVEALRHAAARLARSLREPLARLSGADAADVAIDPPREMAFAQFAPSGLHAYSIYETAPGKAHVLSAIGAEALLRLVDRAFGGPGEAPRPLPRELPMSAELMTQRIEAILAAELARALGSAGAVRPTIHPLRRDSELAQLQAFAPSAPLAVLDIAVSEGTRAPWQMRLGVPIAALGMLTGIAPPADPVARAAVAADPGAEPFAALPLRLTALLVDTRLPLHAVSRLEAGQVLSLPIARQVPLLAGRQTIGHGTIGAIDDRVAIQMTRLV